MPDRAVTFADPNFLIRAVAEVRTDADQGTYKGWACRAGVMDAYHTTFEAGCWDRGTDLDQQFPSLWMHDVWEPIGVFEAEDRGKEGLWIDGDYDETPSGQAARVRAKSGSAPGLSVGFVPVEHRVIAAEEEGDEDEIVFVSCRLIEVSQVTRGFQAVPGSELTDARYRTLVTSEQQHQRELKRAAFLARLDLARSQVGRLSAMPPVPEAGHSVATKGRK